MTPSTSASRRSRLLGALQRFERERAAVSEQLSAAEGRLAQLRRELSHDLQPEPSLAPAGRKARPDPGDDALESWLDAGLKADSRGRPAPGDVRRLAPLLEPARQEVEALRARLGALETQISSFRNWAFEETTITVDPHRLPDLAEVLATDGSECEAFSTLRAKIRRSAKTDRIRCLGLVSATDAEGKTTAALGLALRLAQDRTIRVLLIEADLGAPGVESHLGLQSRRGLSEWLRGSTDSIRLRRLEPSGLHLLAAGMPQESASGLLASERMTQLMSVVRGTFDLIVVDCPPVFPDADSVLWLQDHTDGILFVVRARRTLRQTILASLQHLVPERIHGFIFNDLHEIIPRHMAPRAPRSRQRG